MATDRDEQQRQQRELEEIRRSFAEMGARMGSLFDPAEGDEAERAHGHQAARGPHGGQRARGVRGQRRAGRRGHIPVEPERP
ncbi:MAG TPA: hypothetical protein VG693_12610 [Actinomycetes bacterium]|nr:hypothetical protein [Actinomycetes bacterium]